MSNVKIENLSFSYKDNRIIDDLNFSFKKNKINIILGLNGSGKTTLLKLISKSLQPKKGYAYVDGKDVNNYSVHELSKKISVVNQLSKNNNDFTVLDYLLFGVVNRLKFYNKPALSQIEEVRQLSKKIGIENLLNANMNCISGGEKQMVHLCSALIQNTDVVLLDEPLSALDMKNQNIILQLLKKINDKTIIMTTHNPNICIYLNSYVILLKEGKIVKSGLFDEIIKPEVLKDVYGDNITYVKDTDYNEVTFK